MESNKTQVDLKGDIICAQGVVSFGTNKGKVSPKIGNMLNAIQFSLN